MTYSISQAASRFGVEPHTLRFYEKEGIITPERTESGIRAYTEENMSQLEMAMCLKSTGMPLKDIKRYFELVDAGDDTLDERLKIFTDHREPRAGGNRRAAAAPVQNRGEDQMVFRVY